REIDGAEVCRLYLVNGATTMAWGSSFHAKTNRFGFHQPNKSQPHSHLDSPGTAGPDTLYRKCE
ncbi:unnamed protein product, partial [Ilex paraguariensis]